MDTYQGIYTVVVLNWDNSIAYFYQCNDEEEAGSVAWTWAHKVDGSATSWKYRVILGKQVKPKPRPNYIGHQP